MIVVFLSDIHAMLSRPKSRLDDDIQVTIEHKLSQPLRWAMERRKEGAKVIVVSAGDISDTARSWYVASWLVKFFRSWQEGAEPVMYAVYGQHDLYMHNEESKKATTLGMLEAAGLVTILGKDPVIVGSKPAIFLYGCGYGERDVPKPAYRSKHHLNVLVTHRMVLSKKLWGAQEEYEYASAFLRNYTWYDFILCGDFHYRFLYTIGGRTILNTGCMLRKTASKLDARHRPGFFIHYTEWKRGTVRWMPIAHAPASEVLTREHLDGGDIDFDASMEQFGREVSRSAEGIQESGLFDYERELLDVMDMQGESEGVRKWVLLAVRQGQRS